MSNQIQNVFFKPNLSIDKQNCELSLQNINTTNNTNNNNNNSNLAHQQATRLIPFNTHSHLNGNSLDDSLSLSSSPANSQNHIGQQSHHSHHNRHHHNHHHHSHHRKDKTTRVRTVLNEKQLHTLRACYGANPRPDALMKEQLVEMTGLSPRVIRVWFQNKRCKDKKKSILIKQMQEQQKV